MIAEEYLSRSRLFRRLKSGPHGQLVELYTAHLVRDELAGHGTWRCLNLVGDLLSWIKRCRLKLTDVDERVADAHLALKEAALAKLKPYEYRKQVRFQPSDRLLAFLEAL